jgi:hypothetical protein
MADSCVPEPFARVPKGIYTAGLNLYATTLYGWLSAAYGGYKVIRPAVATLAADLGWSARTVKRVLRDLEEAGWLTITERPGTSSVYELARDSRAAAQNRRSLQEGVSGQSPVTAESPRGVSGQSPRGCPASHPIQLRRNS